MLAGAGGVGGGEGSEIRVVPGVNQCEIVMMATESPGVDFYGLPETFGSGSHDTIELGKGEQSPLDKG